MPAKLVAATTRLRPAAPTQGPCLQVTDDAACFEQDAPMGTTGRTMPLSAGDLLITNPALSYRCTEGRNVNAKNNRPSRAWICNIFAAQHQIER
jgi:hypothetical protein